MSLSYTSASDFQTCKARYFHKHVAKDAPFESTPQMDYGNQVHEAFKACLSAGKVFPDELKKFEKFALAALNTGQKMLVEHRLGIRVDGTSCGFYDEDRAWNGKLDLVLMNDVTALLFDWKTGKEREDPFELKVQAVLLCAAYPNLNTFKGRYVWLKQNKMGELHNLTDVQRTWAEMRSISNLIEQHAGMNHWPEQENPLCGWCPVKQCRFYKGALAAAK